MSSNLAFKIDSPYAKFGSGGQLTCTLCNCPVKSAKVWIAHINGRQHREKLASQNVKKQPQQSVKPSSMKEDFSPVSQKRPVPTGVKEFAVPGNKRPAAVGKEHTEMAKKPKIMPPPEDIPVSAQHGPAKALPTKIVPDEDSSESSDDEPAASSTGLPSDFFDAPSSAPDSHSVSQQKSDEESSKVAPSPAQQAVKPKGEDLPEGFFDDRKMDARVRGVELKDPLDDEWSKFQKEIQKVEAASEQIVEEDEDQMALERELDEAEEQMREWSRINELEKRKEAVDQSEQVRTGKETMADVKEESDEELDENNLENIFDWRSKDAWR